MNESTKGHFGFTKLVVTDLDASAAFYTTVFGVTEQYRVTAEIAGRPIDEILFEATAAGGAVAQAVEAQPEHGVHVGSVTDPEGHLIEVGSWTCGSIRRRSTRRRFRRTADVEVGQHGQKRSNDTHASTTDPEPRLCRKSNHTPRLVVAHDTAKDRGRRQGL